MELELSQALDNLDEARLEAQTLWQKAYATQIDAQSQLYLSYVKYLKASGQLDITSH